MAESMQFEEDEILDAKSISEAFSTAHEIEDSSRYVGRSEEIKKCILGLVRSGAFIVIHGQRGVGKSSTANQLINIATGDRGLARKLGLEKLLPSEKRGGLSFLVAKCVADTSVGNIDELLNRILVGDKAHSGIERMVEEVAGINLNGERESLTGAEDQICEFSEESDKRYDSKGKRSSDTVIRFRHLLSRIEDEKKDDFDGLLIVVDEFDLIEDTKGFSSLVKSIGSKFFKFAVVGVASTVKELVKDHNSITRKQFRVHVGLMQVHEIELILENAQERLNNKIVFEQNVKDDIADYSEGFPFFGQLIGEECMLNAFLRGSSIVEQIDFEHFVERLAEDDLDVVFSGVYQDVVVPVKCRREMLKHVATFQGEVVNVKQLVSKFDAYKESTIKRELNALSKPVNGHEPVFVKLSPNEFRFIDPLFKAYCRMHKIGEDFLMERQALDE